MTVKSQIVPIFLVLVSLVIIYLALQLDLSPPMIVGDSMQPRSFPYFFNGFEFDFDRAASPANLS